MSATAVKLLGETGQAEAILHPVRRQVLSLLAKPDSASGLARALNLPRQRVNYHLRELETQGLLEFVEERKRGNCTERIVRATARSYLIDPALLGSLAANPDEIADKFSSTYLVALAAKTISDVAELRRRAERAEKKLPTLSLLSEVRFETPTDQVAFTTELTVAISRLAAKYHNEHCEGGRTFRFVMSAYPAITKPENETEPQTEGAHP